MSLFVGLIILGIIFFFVAIILYRSFPGISPKTVRRIMFLGLLFIVSGIVLCIYRPKSLGKYLNPPSTSPAPIEPDTEEKDSEIDNESISLDVIVRHGKVIINGKDFGSVEALSSYLHYYDGTPLTITLVDDYASAKTYHDTYDFLKSMKNISIDSEIPIERFNNED